MKSPRTLNCNMDEDVWAGMVDIGSKPVVAREAVATGLLVLSETAIDAVSYTHLTLPTILLV